MTVQVAVRFALSDMGEIDGAKLGRLIATLRDMPGVDVTVDAPSADELDEELDGLRSAREEARAHFRASTGEIDAVQARIDSARAVNTWLRRVEEARG